MSPSGLGFELSRRLSTTTDEKPVLTVRFWSACVCLLRYGMGALGGERAASVLLPYMTSDAKWRRKAATFALGEGAPLTSAVVEALCLRIAEDESVYVRAVAAVALGCLYRRSVASTDHQDGKAQLQVRTQPVMLATLETLSLLSAV